MSVTQTQELPISWVKNFTEITKLRLSVSVVFSSVAGYLLGATKVDFMILLLLCIGGYCMVGASNVYNQVMERDLDTLMDRTKNRPIPAGTMSVDSVHGIQEVWPGRLGRTSSAPGLSSPGTIFQLTLNLPAQ